MNYEAEVKKVYPNAYMCHNTLFETCCIYEDRTFKNRVGERVRTAWEAWQSAYETLKKQNKL